MKNIKLSSERISFAKLMPRAFAVFCAIALIANLNLHAFAYDMPNISPGQQEETLPEAPALIDMIGMVRYNGKLYTQAEYIHCSEEEKIPFIGEYLGTARGNIVEYSEEKEFLKDFASNVPGKVYSVNGYSPDFRICIPNMYNNGGFIAFFEYIDASKLKIGKDLFGDKIKLKDNIKSVSYILYDYPNTVMTAYKKLKNITDSSIAAFSDALYRAKFYSSLETNIWEKFAGKKSVALKFKLNDNSVFKVTLYEEGQVFYGLGNVTGHKYLNFEEKDLEVFRNIFFAALNNYPNTLQKNIIILPY